MQVKNYEKLYKLYHILYEMWMKSDGVVHNRDEISIAFWYEGVRLYLCVSWMKEQRRHIKISKDVTSTKSREKKENRKKKKKITKETRFARERFVGISFEIQIIFCTLSIHIPKK